MRAADARERRRRRLLWIAVPCAVALLAAVKLGSVVPLGSFAQQGFDSGDSDAVAVAAGLLGTANVIEPFKADFARGDAAALDGDFAEARAAFARALDAAPDADACKVRVNLALSMERLGDASADAADARDLYLDSRAVVDGAGDGCHDDGAPGNRDGEGEQLTAAAARLESKLAASESAAEQPAETEDSSDEPQDSQTDELDQRSADAQRSRWATEDSEDYLESDPEQLVDEPW